jgi:hypothetical protein
MSRRADPARIDEAGRAVATAPSAVVHFGWPLAGGGAAPWEMRMDDSR